MQKLAVIFAVSFHSNAVVIVLFVLFILCFYLDILLPFHSRHSIAICHSQADAQRKCPRGQKFECQCVEEVRMNDETEIQVGANELFTILDNAE